MRRPLILAKRLCAWAALLALPPSMYSCTRGHVDGLPPPAYPMDTEPSWAPDGEHIAFVTSRMPHRVGTLYELNLATRNIRPVAPAVPLAAGPQYSPDSKRLIFSSGGCAWVADLTSGEMKNLNASSDPGDVAFDPMFRTASTVVFWRKPRRHAYNSVLQFSLGPDMRKTKLEVLIQSDHDLLLPIPSHDGTKIAYCEIIDDALGSFRGGETRIRLWDAETLESTTAFVSPVMLDHISWFPENAGLLVVARGGTEEVPMWYSLDLATCVPQGLSLPHAVREGMLGQLEVSPDGQWICFPRMSSEGRAVTLWRSHLDGSDAEELTHLPKWYYGRFPDRKPINGCDTYYGNPDFDPLAQDGR
jgi:Tol biopolymer transport system component